MSFHTHRSICLSSSLVHLIRFWNPVQTNDYHLDANKTAGEEARRQLHKNVASNIEQVPAATPTKASTIRPPAPHHENYTS